MKKILFVEDQPEYKLGALLQYLKMKKDVYVVGVEPKIYTIPTKLKAVCRNAACSKPCPLSFSSNPDTAQYIDVDPRQMLNFLDSSDNTQDTFLRKLYGCKSVTAEPVDYTNVQKVIFQESASFVDGLDESSFESRYGLYMYSDFRLSATLKYNFEACRVTSPRTQQNYYVIRKAENLAALKPVINTSVFEHFRKVAQESSCMAELIQRHYQEWMPALAIEGRPDLFGALVLTYCSVTEIPWQAGIIKGWLDTMVIGDTRTGKSQMAQRMVKALGMGGYINGENAKIYASQGQQRSVVLALKLAEGEVCLELSGDYLGHYSDERQRTFNHRRSLWFKRG